VVTVVVVVESSVDVCAEAAVPAVSVAAVATLAVEASVAATDDAETGCSGNPRAGRRNCIAGALSPAASKSAPQSDPLSTEAVSGR
jgi:hypothetical protein